MLTKTNKTTARAIDSMLVNNTTDVTSVSTKKSFAFDNRFQEKIVQAMLIDRVWCSQFAEVVDVEFFEYSYLRKIAATHLEYYVKYKEFPSTYLLAQIIVKELKHGSDTALKDQIQQFLLRVEDNKELSDLGYVKEKSLEFCKKAGLQKALIHAVDLIEHEKHEKIVDVIKAAISAGEAQSHGLDLKEDIEARYSETYRKTVATGIQELDTRKILNGGLGAGELGIVVAPTSCHAKGTQILMFDGSLKNVEDIKVGDQLMGPDSKSREVLSLTNGMDNMYKICPKKGKDFIVNSEHLLSLRRTNRGKGKSPNKDGKVINISVKEYLKNSKSFKHIHKLWHPEAITFPNKNKLPISPYTLGLLLGDGSLKDNKAYGLYLTNAGKHNNPITNKLRALGLLNKTSGSKFIPQIYKTASIAERLELLAGLIDTDGFLTDKCFEYVTKSNQLADDVEFIAKSLGLATSRKNKEVSGMSYQRIYIFGNTNMVPTRLLRKQASIRTKKKNVLNSGFSIKEMGTGNYYGFTLDKDHLYMTDDFVVNHNCGKSHFLVQLGSAAILQGKNVLHYTFELNERATGVRYDSNLLGIDSTDCPEAKELIKKYYEKNANNLGALKIKYYPTGQATIQTFRSHIDKLSVDCFRPDMVIVDYAGIMRSTEKYELLRLELKKICEDLRGFANEMDIPVWTAIQSNKEGANQEIVDLTNMAEAYGQAHVADFVLGLTRNKSTGYGTIYIAKNRAGMDGIQYKIYMDTAQSKLRIITDQEFINSVNNETETEEQSMRNLLRQKIRDYQNGQK